LIPETEGTVKGDIQAVVDKKADGGFIELSHQKKEGEGEGEEKKE
jgi:hypothetical protein